jgi:hypothetical protein
MRGPEGLLPSIVKYVASLVVVASFVVTEAASAKCSSTSISDRFSEAGTVVLVSITDARDGPVPSSWFVKGLGGSLPGRLLTLRIIRSWKGSLRPDDIVSGWTLAPRVEDAYPLTDEGTQIIVFFYKGSRHEIMACNAAAPDHLNEVSEELDAIVRDHATPSSASKACSVLKERIGVHDGVPPTALGKTWFCRIAKDPYGENPPDWWVIGLRSSRQCDGICSNLRGWFAVNRLTNEVREFDMGRHAVGGPIGKP